MYCSVLVTKPFDQTFIYKLKHDQSVTQGNIVLVPFGNKNDQIGMVYETYKNLPGEASGIRLKNIEFVFIILTDYNEFIILHCQIFSTILLII